VAFRDTSDAAKLIRRDPPRHDGESRVRQPWLSLGMDADMVADPRVRDDLVDRWFERIPDPPLDLPQKRLGGPSMVDEEKLHPRLRAVCAKLIGIAKDPANCLDDIEHLLAPHECIELHREMRPSRQASAHADVIADVAPSTHGCDADVVDLRIRAPMRAPGYRDLELPRQVGELWVPVERAVDLDGERGRIDDLVSIDAGEWTTGYRPCVVSARSHAGPANRLERIPDRRDVFDPQPVKLEVLPIGDVDRAACITIGEIRDRAHHR
jgi:hypothetical protein